MTWLHAVIAWGLLAGHVSLYLQVREMWPRRKQTKCRICRAPSQASVCWQCSEGGTDISMLEKDDEPIRQVLSQQDRDALRSLYKQNVRLGRG